MKLYIFKPSEHWQYCGGALLISANSFQEIVDNFSHIDDEFGGDDLKFYEQEFTEEQVTQFNDSYCWILHAVFEVPEITESKIILYDYNYA